VSPVYPAQTRAQAPGLSALMRHLRRRVAIRTVYPVRTSRKGWCRHRAATGDVRGIDIAQRLTYGVGTAASSPNSSRSSAPASKCGRVSETLPIAPPRLRAKRTYEIMKKSTSLSPEQPPALRVIAIGGSAGALHALSHFFRAASGVPADTAFVVVVHLSPDSESHLAELLARTTLFSVATIADNTPILGGHVYVIPPKVSVTVSGAFSD
jgi:chemotaxis response regulator CheB